MYLLLVLQSFRCRKKLRETNKQLFLLLKAIYPPSIWIRGFLLDLLLSFLLPLFFHFYWLWQLLFNCCYFGISQSPLYHNILSLFFEIHATTTPLRIVHLKTHFSIIRTFYMPRLPLPLELCFTNRFWDGAYYERLHVCWTGYPLPNNKVATNSILYPIS